MSKGRLLRFLLLAGVFSWMGCAVKATRRKLPAATDGEPASAEREPMGAPFLRPSDPLVLDPNYRTQPAPRAPAYFYFVVGEDPGGRLAEALEVACIRWAEATGVQIEVGRGSEMGLASGSETEHRVSWARKDQPPLNGASGKALFDNWMRTEVFIADSMQSASEAGLVNLLTHELGHSLGRRGDHTATGVMAESFSSSALTPINGESLVHVCERLLCPVMRPEAEEQ